MNSILQTVEKVDSVLAESKRKRAAHFFWAAFTMEVKMDIGDIKGKAQLYLIDHLSMIKEKEYPYNYNEISEVIDKLADIFYEEDQEKEETVPQEDYDDLEMSYGDLKEGASWFKENIESYLKELENFEKLKPEEIKEILKKAKLECSDFDWYC